VTTRRADENIFLFVDARSITGSARNARVHDLLKIWKQPRWVDQGRKTGHENRNQELFWQAPSKVWWSMRAPERFVTLRSRQVFLFDM
jgi:hypothetical protein